MPNLKEEDEGRRAYKNLADKHESRQIKNKVSANKKKTTSSFRHWIKKIFGELEEPVDGFI